MVTLRGEKQVYLSEDSRSMIGTQNRDAGITGVTGALQMRHVPFLEASSASNTRHQNNAGLALAERLRC